MASDSSYIYDNGIAGWLEEALEAIITHKGKRIAILSMDESGACTRAYFKCRSSDLFTMAGVLQYEGFMSELEHDKQRLREYLEDNEEDGEGG